MIRQAGRLSNLFRISLYYFKPKRRKVLQVPFVPHRKHTKTPLENKLFVLLRGVIAIFQGYRKQIYFMDIIQICARFDILTSVLVKILVFWDVALCLGE